MTPRPCQVLDRVRAPADVRALPAADLPRLAADLRAEIVSSVSRTGGHLASSLGAVELVIGLLRVFDPARVRVVWDVGHQTYAWKLLTGRRGGFGTIRTLDGLSGFCNPEESDCDAFVSGHAGSALAVAAGMAAAAEPPEVVAVVGDASLANGVSLEALANLSSGRGRLVLVVNDNGQAGVGPRLGRAFFEGFGLDYAGPVDGHDVEAVAAALESARRMPRSVAVHVVTVKGKGFAPAEADPAGWHGVGPFDVAAAGAQAVSAPGSWSAAFGGEAMRLAAADPRVCALTAAMRDGTGLAPFAAAHPDRFFDSGICEEHLVAFAAGLAKAGMRPLVAVYSTFLQRAVDQVMHDVCLLGLPVVFAVDRAGCVGRDGRTHHGMFDVAMLRCLPGLTICQPADAGELRQMLDLAVAQGGPWVVRYPRGAAAAARPASNPVRTGRAEQVCGADAEVQIWALGGQVAKARAACGLLAGRGVRAGVVNARFVKPFDAELLAAQRAAGRWIVSLEDGAVAGGFGEAIGADLKLGWPDVFIGHGDVSELEARHGLTAEAVAEAVARACPRRGGNGLDAE